MLVFLARTVARSAVHSFALALLDTISTGRPLGALLPLDLRHLPFENLALPFLPFLRLFSPRLPDLLQLPLPHNLTLNLALFLRVNQRQDRHHRLLVVNEHFALLLASRRLGYARRRDHVQCGEVEFLVRVDSLFLLGGGPGGGLCSGGGFSLDLFGWAVDFGFRNG